MRARPSLQAPPKSEHYQASVDAQTEPALPLPPQPPVEAIGRAPASTSTCVESANLIDSTSGSPAVTENPAPLDTLPALPLSPQPPVGAIGRVLTSTSTCVELANLIDSTSGSPAVMENPVQIDTHPRAHYWPVRQH